MWNVECAPLEAAGVDLLVGVCSWVRVTYVKMGTLLWESGGMIRIKFVKKFV